jgi:cation:H+ antiporter
VPQTLLALVALLASVAAIVWGAETFAEHLTDASARLGVTTFALALLLAGAEPEELATSVTAALRGVPAIAYGDVIGTNVAMCTVALGLAALIAPLPFGARVRRYALLASPSGWSRWCWSGTVTSAAARARCWSACTPPTWR